MYWEFLAPCNFYAYTPEFFYLFFFGGGVGVGISRLETSVWCTVVIRGL